MTGESKIELAEIVLKYRDEIMADCCEPEESENLWMELADWFGKNSEVKA